MKKVMQFSFWGNVEYSSNKDAMLERNKLASVYKKQGFKVSKRSLTGQMRKYTSFGKPDGTIGTVYYLDVFIKE